MMIRLLPVSLRVIAECSSSGPHLQIGALELAPCIWRPVLPASPEDLPSTSGRHSVWPLPLHHQQQWRGYKSSKRSFKPRSTSASWRAAEPFLPAAAAAAAAPRKPHGEEEEAGAPIVDSCIPEIPTAPQPEPFRRMGMITGSYRLELQKVFAVVQVGGTQFKVTPDDVLFVNRLHGTDVNDVLQLSAVLMLGSRAETVIGRPHVPGAAVLVAVEEHFKDGKVHVFKRTPRKRYRRYKSPRQYLTTLRVLEVRGIEPAAGDAVKQPPLPIAWGTGPAAVAPGTSGPATAGALRPGPAVGVSGFGRSARRLRPGPAKPRPTPVGAKAGPPGEAGPTTATASGSGAAENTVGAAATGTAPDS